MSTRLLVDNGSLRPASTRALRNLAQSLSRRVGYEVQPVSLLHSAKIPAEELDGLPAEVLEPALRRRLEAGEADFKIVPLFFGPSRALTDYLPKRVAALRRRFPELRLRCASNLFDVMDGCDSRLAGILRDHVLEQIDLDGPPPAVALVDHGSPEPAVTHVRNFIAGQLSLLLQGKVARVAAASMERREGEEYRFNEPLLEDLLRRDGFNHGPVVIAMLFLSPGRHAGPDGDVAAICARAEEEQPGLRASMTRLAGEHPRLMDILVERFQQVEAGGGTAC